MERLELGPILILDGDQVFRRATRRVLEPIALVAEADCCATASELVREGARAFIIEIALRDGSGLDWLAVTRRAHPNVPALVLTSQCDATLDNRAFNLGAYYARKPLSAASLRKFARSTTMRALQRDPVGASAAQLAVTHGLSSSEAVIIERALRGTVARSELAAATGLNTNTLKSQIRRALKKLDAKSLGEVRDRVLRGDSHSEG